MGLCGVIAVYTAWHRMQQPRALRATILCGRSRWSRVGVAEVAGARQRQMQKQKQIHCWNDNKKAEATTKARATAKAGVDAVRPEVRFARDQRERDKSVWRSKVAAAACNA